MDTINVYVECYECEHGWNVGELLMMNYYDVLCFTRKWNKWGIDDYKKSDIDWLCDQRLWEK